jgi:hypothetical protein
MFQLRVISFLWEKQEIITHKTMQFKEAIVSTPHQLDTKGEEHRKVFDLKEMPA